MQQRSSISVEKYLFDNSFFLQIHKHVITFKVSYYYDTLFSNKNVVFIASPKNNKVNKKNNNIMIWKLQFWPTFHLKDCLSCHYFNS